MVTALCAATLSSPRPPLSKPASRIILPWSQSAPDSMSDKRERERRTVCPQDGATRSGFGHGLAHHQLLAVVDLLIDAATETHWKSPGTGPMTWTYALFFMHVVVPKCTLPHSYIQHHWKHSMLCAKNDLKTFRQVHWGCMTCQRLHEIDKPFFCTLLRVLKRSRQTPIIEVVTWWWDALFLHLFFFLVSFLVHLSQGYLSLYQGQSAFSFPFFLCSTVDPPCRQN